VVDVAAYNPAHVRRSVDVLSTSARYAFVSSVSVYVDQSAPPVEGAAVHELTPGDESDVGTDTYGARKAACEQVVLDAFGDRALLVRPGLIVGPHDPTGRFTYWPHRVARGGDVLAPGSPDDPVQFIDVRDLARWIVRAATNDRCVQRDGRDDIRGLLHECRRAGERPASPGWTASGSSPGRGEWMGCRLVASPG
jgi:2'-hydroxyisoflavone reductase